MNKNREECYVLTEKLEEITWALDGSCNDIDCDKYMYKRLLKKKYKPVLKHSYSCIPKLKMEKEAVMRLLSLKKFRQFRYKKCEVCGRKIDSLGKHYAIVSFTKPAEYNGKRVYECKLIRTHKKCKHKVSIPMGWQKMG
ncbi:hypothetical protein HYV80_06440 [Candidatus Woesearchaeota archaeon]|nr:hypothetical protein [Candidatus Woesearchaeota archaeon]